MDGRDDFYVILGVGRTATLADIKKSFRKLARQFHPDVNPGDHLAEERFKRITDAYEVLSHPDKRHFYDENGFYSEETTGKMNQRTAWGFTFQGFTFSAADARNNSDLFGAPFRRARARVPARGSDLEYQISIGFMEAIAGLKAQISVNRRRPCSSCSGNVDSSYRGNACMTCGGSGRTERIRGQLHFSSNCTECGGSGRSSMECAECGGEGRVRRTETFIADIPAGVGSASRVRFPEQGDAGQFGGPAGDLYVITNVAPHPFFARVAEHLQCALPISFAEAALGAKVNVPTIDGNAVLRIPPGTQNGQILRMRGKGVPSLLHPGTRGDQLVEVRVMVPRVADERSKEILREFARLNSENPRKGLPGNGQ